MKIRQENEQDARRIEEILMVAFEEKFKKTPIEHLLVADLRQNGALAVSLVAEVEGVVVGYIAFSAVTVGGANLAWYGLGPVAVSPDYQNQGIGAGLVLAGIEAIKQLGAKGCVVFGAPDYYGRFGFTAKEGLVFIGAPAKYFMAVSFDGETPTGTVEYHEAFSKFG